MKKFLLLMAIMPLLFSSCKKSNDYDSSDLQGKLFKVNFSVESFNQTIRPMGMKFASTIPGLQDNLKFYEIANYLNVYIFGDDNNLVAKKTNVLVDVEGNPLEGGDKFTFELPKGNYKITAVAHNGTANNQVNLLNDISVFYGYNTSNSFSKGINEYSELYKSDVVSFSVQKDETLPPVILFRLNSRLEIEIVDEIPSDVEYILIGGLLPNTLYPFRENPFSSYVSSKQYLRFDVKSYVGKKNVILSKIIFSPNKDIFESDKLEILLYNKDFVLLSNKTISNVEFKPNFITKLTGNFFDQLNGKEHTNSLSVDFLKEYSTEKINIQF